MLRQLKKKSKKISQHKNSYMTPKFQCPYIELSENSGLLCTFDLWQPSHYTGRADTLPRMSYGPQHSNIHYPVLDRKCVQPPI
jgi:hypothetical protein